MTTGIRGFMNDERFLVLGAGMMGRAIAFDLVSARGKGSVVVMDSDDGSCRSLEAWLDIEVINLDIKEEERLYKEMENSDIIIVALPYQFNIPLMKMAVETGCNFCDLGGNDPIVSEQLALDSEAKSAGVLCVPDCGLAPGMANVLAAHLVPEFDKVECLNVRVGGLPQNPKPPLNYQLVFSVGGLINEYVEKCKVLREGKIRHVEPMRELESVVFAGFGELEAFTTSGGTARLPEMFEGRIDSLDYKTVRYPGHCDLMKDLLNREPVHEDADMSGVGPRETLEKHLKGMLTGDDEDVVLVRVSAEGRVAGERKGISLEIIDYFDEENDISAMMRCTSYPTSIIAQQIVDSRIPTKGVMTPEMCVPGADFLDELASRNIVVNKKIWDR